MSSPDTPSLWRDALITAPDDTFTPEEAAPLLRRSPRQVQRLLASGKLKGTNPTGRWSVTALALWRFLGIEEEMTNLWLEYCRRAQKNTDEAS